MFRKRFKAKDGSEPDKRKIKSTKVEQDGIVFDSKLENYLYNILKENNIQFELKPQFQLLESFNYRHESILGMVCTPDYYLPEHDILVDCKGFSNELSPVRYKLLKHTLTLQGKSPRIVMPSTQTKCRKLIQDIKQGFFTVDEPITEHAATRRKNKLKKAGFSWKDNMWEKNNGQVNFVAYHASHLMALHSFDFEELLLKHQ